MDQWLDSCRFEADPRMRNPAERFLLLGVGHFWIGGKREVVYGTVGPLPTLPADSSPADEVHSDGHSDVSQEDNERFPHGSLPWHYDSDGNLISDDGRYDSDGNSLGEEFYAEEDYDSDGNLWPWLWRQ